MSKSWISAKIIADSINPDGIRITSWLLRFPRIVLAEFNTHRAFSRNSASSRAIPYRIMLRMVMTDPFVPQQWMKNHTGMQGSDFYSAGVRTFLMRQLWLTARNFAVLFSLMFNWLGLTKQISNRLLEAFMWHTVIMTATDMENYFALRAEENAEIHIQELAYLMLSEYNLNSPKLLEYGGWHIPFGDQMDTQRIHDIVSDMLGTAYSEWDYTDAFEQIQLSIATARCARVSYMNFDGHDDYEADVMLFERLKKLGHLSPFEHCAMSVLPQATQLGNFRGFKQLRKTFINENRKDERVVTQI